MARLVIKDFVDKTDGTYYCAVRKDIYNGDREKDLYKLGYLGDELEVENIKENVDYSCLKSEELKNILKKRGIRFRSNLKKDELIKLLEG